MTDADHVENIKRLARAFWRAYVMVRDAAYERYLRSLNARQCHNARINR